MLFNLAKAIGLEAGYPVSTVRTLPQPSAVENAVKTDKTDESTDPQHNLLPEYHYRATHLTPWKVATNVIESIRYNYSDTKWIEAKLRRLPVSKRQSIVHEYSRRYKKAFDAEPNQIKKENRARFITNNWLLQTTKLTKEE
jgi:uncharacterized protein (DUF2252 family)